MMADMKIVDKVKEKLTSEEWLNVVDYIRLQISYEDRKGYDKGYQAGKKYANHENKQEVKG